MAVDEWLLESIVCPVLRVYEWKGKWGSLGRFCCLNQAIDNNSSVCWIRRSTGGGIVDHQNDWTYSLVIPETENLARIGANESYKQIHETLAVVLSDRFKLVDSIEAKAGLGGICFEKPVISDVVDNVGNKVAGAGQRRTKQGLLHQGSVIGKCESTDSIDRSKRFAGLLTDHWEQVEIVIPGDRIAEKIAERYGNPDWTGRR